MSNDIAESINQLIAGHFGHLAGLQDTVLYHTKLFCMIQNSFTLYAADEGLSVLQSVD